MLHISFRKIQTQASDSLTMVCGKTSFKCDTNSFDAERATKIQDGLEGTYAWSFPLDPG